MDVLLLPEALTDGRRYRLHRIARDLTQFQVAVMARCSPAHVSMLERDVPVPASVRVRLLRAMDLDLTP